MLICEDEIWRRLKSDFESRGRRVRAPAGIARLRRGTEGLDAFAIDDFETSQIRFGIVHSTLDIHFTPRVIPNLFRNLFVAEGSGWMTSFEAQRQTYVNL